jgi:hypothetical protein
LTLEVINMPKQNLLTNIATWRPTQARRALMPVLGFSLLVISACTPTVQVAMPSEPITINLNVRIEHEIRVRVERELDDMFSADSGLF